MKKYITILVSSLIIISGGCNNAEKEANKRLEQARINLENNDFFAARNEIDSIRKFYPKEYKILKNLNIKKLYYAFFKGCYTQTPLGLSLKRFAVLSRYK